MELRSLLEKCGLRSLDISNIEGITVNSKDAKNKLFVAIKGLNQDGHDYIEEALQNGALAVVAQKTNFKHSKIILVKDTPAMLSKLSSIYYQYDPTKMICVGITGTNGKTTLSYMLENILTYLGVKVGVIGTIDSHYKNHKFESTLTTPDAITLHKILNAIQKLGGNTCVMEVSSHAIIQSRVSSIIFNCALFTNLTADHLDYHKDMDDYFGAKKKLFSSNNLSIINTDCQWGRKLSNTLSNKITYGTKDQDVVVTNVKSHITYVQFDILYKNTTYKKKINMAGKHNAINFAGSFATCVGLGYKPEEILKANINPVPGRMELVTKNEVYCFVDYSHTEDALLSALKSLNEIKPVNSKIITVFGCGGGRDRDKRPKMAKVSESFSDYVIVTSDNPRFEKMEDIICRDQIWF